MAFHSDKTHPFCRTALTGTDGACDHHKFETLENCEIAVFLRAYSGFPQSVKRAISRCRLYISDTFLLCHVPINKF